MAVLSRTGSRARSKAQPVSIRIGPVLLIAGAAIVVIALLQVLQTSQATTTSFSIQQLKEEKVQLEAAARQLEAEVAGLSSLARIEREAARLGLVPAAQQRTVEVNVAWAGAGSEVLPARYAPSEEAEAEVEEQGSSWWQDLLAPLPFY